MYRTLVCGLYFVLVYFCYERKLGQITLFDQIMLNKTIFLFTFVVLNYRFIYLHNIWRNENDVYFIIHDKDFGVLHIFGSCFCEKWEFWYYKYLCVTKEYFCMCECIDFKWKSILSVLKPIHLYLHYWDFLEKNVYQWIFIRIIVVQYNCKIV